MAAQKSVEKSAERLSPKEAAELIGVHEVLLKQARQHGNKFADGWPAPPYFHPTPRKIFYLKQDVLDWLEASKVE